MQCVPAFGDATIIVLPLWVWRIAVAQMTVTPVAVKGLFVDGRWIEEGDVIEIKAPFDGAVMGRVFQGTRKHADAAIAAAVKAFGTTRRLPAFERQRVLRQVAEGISNRKEEFSRTLARKPANRSKPRVSKLIARFSRSTSRPRRASEFTANIFRWTGRNTPPGGGASLSRFRSDRSPESLRLTFRSIWWRTK